MRMSSSFLKYVLQLKCLHKYPQATNRTTEAKELTATITWSIFSKASKGSVDTLLLMFCNSFSRSWQRAATQSAILDVDTGSKSSSVK